MKTLLLFVLLGLVGCSAQTAKGVGAVALGIASIAINPMSANYGDVGKAYDAIGAVDYASEAIPTGSAKTVSYGDEPDPLNWTPKR